MQRQHPGGGMFMNQAGNNIQAGGPSPQQQPQPQPSQMQMQMQMQQQQHQMGQSIPQQMQMQQQRLNPQQQPPNGAGRSQQGPPNISTGNGPLQFNPYSQGGSQTAGPDANGPAGLSQGPGPNGLQPRPQAAQASAGASSEFGGFPGGPSGNGMQQYPNPRFAMGNDMKNVRGNAPAGGASANSTTRPLYQQGQGQSSFGQQGLNGSNGSRGPQTHQPFGQDQFAQAPLQQLQQSNNSGFNGDARNMTALQDYQNQLMLLEKQNKKRLDNARNSSGSIEPVSGGLSTFGSSQVGNGKLGLMNGGNSLEASGAISNDPSSVKDVSSSSPLIHNKPSPTMKKAKKEASTPILASTVKRTLSASARRMSNTMGNTPGSTTPSMSTIKKEYATPMTPAAELDHALSGSNAAANKRKRKVPSVAESPKKTIKTSPNLKKEEPPLQAAEVGQSKDINTESLKDSMPPPQANTSSSSANANKSSTSMNGVGSSDSIIGGNNLASGLNLVQNGVTSMSETSLSLEFVDDHGDLDALTAAPSEVFNPGDGNMEELFSFNPFLGGTGGSIDDQFPWE